LQRDSQVRPRQVDRQTTKIELRLTYLFMNGPLVAALGHEPRSTNRTTIGPRSVSGV
jgi:hypothetical protein